MEMAELTEPVFVDMIERKYIPWKGGDKGES